MSGCDGGGPSAPGSQPACGEDEAMDLSDATAAAAADAAAGTHANSPAAGDAHGSYCAGRSPRNAGSAAPRAVTVTSNWSVSTTQAKFRVGREFRAGRDRKQAR